MQIKLTKTHLSHSTLNAGKFEKAFSDILGFNFSDIPQGGHNGLEMPCIIEKGESSEITTLKLYKPASKPEKRLWLMGLKQWAKAGDILNFFDLASDKTGGHYENAKACKIICCIETPDE